MKKICVLLIYLISLTNVSAQGLEGYISSSSIERAEGYDMGLGFYSAIWTLTPEPIRGFQIGLPGTWIIPNNFDNESTPLCPIGTIARDNWPERAPTYRDVFQTMEGGIGYWAGNRFHYGPPKYSMNCTPNCYNNQIASPGWPFFNSSAPLPDELLGIAQLSNRMIIPPDGLTFAGNPQGAFLGYGYLALPLTEERSLPQPTGNNNWTLFLNSENFKGPLAYFVPETWSKISKDYPFDHGRGLDSRPAIPGAGGTMEINSVPLFKEVDSQGTTYSKIPSIQFPVDAEAKTILTRELAYYSKDALYNDVLAWKAGGDIPNGTFKPEGVNYPKIITYPVNYRQEGIPIQGINELASPKVFEDNAFGLQWNEVPEGGFGRFPSYFKEENNQMLGITEEDLPPNMDLKTREFSAPIVIPPAYEIPLENAWGNPGPSSGPFSVELNDGSLVTYYWYRFIDQPVFQQFNWTEEEKANLQALIEAMHEHWTIDKEYMHPLAKGSLVAFDPNLLVTPPAGMEKGYVPIVTRQSHPLDIDCSSIRPAIRSVIIEATEPDTQDKVQIDISQAERDAFLIRWHTGTSGNTLAIEKGETYSAILNYKNGCTFYHYSPPLALKASGLDENGFLINWKKVPAAKSYLIDIALDEMFTNLLSGWDSREVGDLSQIEVPLDNFNQTLYYRVRALGFNGELSDYSNVITLEPNTNDCSLEVLIDKQNLSSAGLADGQITLNIRGNKGNVTYQWDNNQNQASLNNLSAGTYAFTVTDADACSVASSVSIGLPIGKNAIGNRVWMDLNRNGFQDFEEPGIADVGLVLWTDRSGDGIPETFLGITKTDENGYYRFDNLTPGIYQVFVWEIDNWDIGGPLEGLVNTLGASDPNNDIDHDDNGQDASEIQNLNDLNKISKPIIITEAGEPLNDGDPEDPNFNYDPAGNMTIDFGFYDPRVACPPLNFTINGTLSTCRDNPDGQLSVALASGLAPFNYLWNNGATTPQLEGLEPGNYSVSITDRLGCQEVASFEIAELEEVNCDNVTNLNDFKTIADRIEIYPNPGKDQLFINNSLGQVLDVQFFSQSGQLLLQQRLGMEENVLSLPKLPKNVYILRFVNGSRTTTIFKRWVKIE